MKKAMIAMSGGVDSSVAAWLMKRDGYDCMGVTMRLFAGEDSCERKGHTCCSLDDVEDARSVARQLGIPYFVFNFTEDFGTQIMDRFVCAYENGFTPNPCIDCNRYMKFEKLMKRAKELDYDYVVTGHYARIEEQDGKFLLKKAIDEKKDQSYVLYSLTQEQLAHTLFPLGGRWVRCTRPRCERSRRSTALSTPKSTTVRISALYRTEIMPDLLNDTPAKALSRAIS